MKYRIEFAKDQEEDVVVYAKRECEALKKIEVLLRDDEQTLFGYSDGDVIRLYPDGVYCFFIEAAKVFALTDEGKLLVKDRLYRLERMYEEDFVKINQSCLVNISKIKRFDASLGGALMVVLKNGHKDYISRRQLKSVKERLGI